jgi:hypothetical protein
MADENTPAFLGGALDSVPRRATDQMRVAIVFSKSACARDQPEPLVLGICFDAGQAKPKIQN